ncbi:MAG: hypothetical protein JNL70_20365 [Saprospiraceae bacterium]|nr:hypothetical protein [Saprospiraceae bacterium]
MFEYQYHILLDNKPYCSLFGEDYYFDKRVFNVAHGRVLFDIFQKMKAGCPVLTIVDAKTNYREEVKTAEAFRDWVQVNNRGMEGYLTKSDIPTES